MAFTTVKEQKVERNVYWPTFSCRNCTCLGRLLLLQITSKWNSLVSSSILQHNTTQERKYRFCIPYLRIIHSIMSFLTTSSDPKLPEIGFNSWGPQMDICLYWLGIPGIIFVIEGNCLRHVVLVELNSCRPDSLSPFFTLHVERPPGVFWCDELVNCFLTLESDLAIEGGCPPRISADGFILSSHRRIQFPTFRPTSMSLSWIFLWTLITISNIARVRLWYKTKYITMEHFVCLYF